MLSKRLRVRVTIVSLLVGITVTTTGASWAAASIFASYFTWSSASSGNKESDRFGPLNPMRLCGDVQQSTKFITFHARLMRDITAFPDTPQRELLPYHRDAYTCAVLFNGTAGEGYYTNSNWQQELPAKPGFVQITK